MKILVAPNSMKGSISAFRFADIVEKAFLQCSGDFEIRKVPVADGGDFTGEVLQRKFEAREIPLQVTGPLGEKVNSKYFVSGNKAVIEMAEASGMKLVAPGNLNPLKASTFGTGEIIADAISKGCTEIFLAVGGSATVDGGMGMMEALGFTFFNKNNKIITGNGANLSAIKTIQKKVFPGNISIKIISDVDNPLLGKNGAAAVFGPQKGATPEMVVKLENGLKNWSGIVRKETGENFSEIPGTGAAGGIAVPLLAFFDAEIVPGAEFVLSQLDFDDQVKWADIVITGEGKIDAQTLNNKAPMAVAVHARKFDRPVFAVAGKTEKEASALFDGVFSLVNGPVSLEFAMKNAGELLFDFSFELAKTIQKLYTHGK